METRVCLLCVYTVSKSLFLYTILCAYMNVHILNLCVGLLGEAGLPGVRGGGFTEEDSSGPGGDDGHQRAS